MAFPVRLIPLAAALTATAPLSAPADEAASRKFFAEEVQPILKEHCYRCHGEEEKLKGNFRLTSREGLLHGGDLGAAFDEANPAASLLLESIAYTNDDLQMPPKAKLSDAQIAVLTRWVVEHGATYEPSLEIKGAPTEKRSGFTITEQQRNWWSYRPIQGTPPPAVADAEWKKNGIDAFIRQRLDAAGLTPNAPAEPGALCRRVYYDLIGLPPTLDEVRRFETAWAAQPEAAWNALIEDLLSRPQYGEKWARHWLDLVRYAESNGFERDNPKPHIWRYRDYVIDAFNRDKPYDRFIIEQLAGDEIAEPTRDSLVATGFHRLMQWDDEPADRPQHVYDVLADNVAMTSETFLGMTMGCARCHDHKVDPISMKDYYSFMAFFHGVTHYETGGTLVSWASPEERTAFEAARDRDLAELKRKTDALEAEIAARLAATAPQSPSGVAKPLTFIEDARSGGTEWEYTLTEPTPDWKDVGFRDKSWMKGRSGFGTRGTPGSEVRTEWKGKDIWMRATFGLDALPKSLVLEIHHDEDVTVYLNGQLIHEAKGYLTDYEIVELPASALDALQTGRNAIAVHCRQTGGGQYIDLALRTAAASAGDAIDLTTLLRGRGNARLTKSLADHFGRDVVKEWKDLQRQTEDRRRAQPGELINAVTEAGPEARPLTVHLRGSAHAPGDPVVPAFPAILAGGNEPQPATFTPVTRESRTSSGRRLALAQWIASPDNPLTARVIMNRLWQHHFGRGIAPSSNDLGGLGEAPTHPELLDWLASELVRNGWSLKAMHRLILTSQTYRMSSAPNPAHFAKDPENKLFWRYNMRRLTAEEMRDSVLAISGNLNPAPGGPWVFPPLPPEVVATASRPHAVWPVSPKPEDHFRRSVYIHVKRSLRHPMMADFDQADTDSPCAVRFATTVPTQALSMLNSQFTNEQAAVLAARLRTQSPDAAEQVRAGLALVMQRQPTDAEIRHCLNFMDNIRSQSGLDDQAALERFALLALNLNEFVYLD
ncbi:MAG: PSD1 domain-containing protein [Verrucomicrobiales bacterium]|nr:PSD1 domain-containing protein [Verrucomicrobiales bacterium]